MFCCFWPGIVFRGVAPNFRTEFYKLGSLNLAKFGDDRPSELGDWVVKKKQGLNDCNQTGWLA